MQEISTFQYCAAAKTKRADHSKNKKTAAMLFENGLVNGSQQVKNGENGSIYNGVPILKKSLKNVEFSF